MSDDNARELEEFCNRWKKDMFAFCWAFLGDATAAEDAACEAFAAIRRRPELRTDDRSIPSQLLRSALAVVAKYGNGSSPRSRATSRLEDGIRRLPRLERAIVIMRNLLHMEWTPLARAVDLSPAEAHEAWVRGIFQLNEILQRNLPKEHQ